MTDSEKLEEILRRLDRIEQAIGGALQRRDAAPPRASAPAGAGEPVVKFGRDKGVSLADVADLTWYRRAIAQSVASPDKARYLSQNQADLADVDAEIARRNGGDRSEPPERPFPEEDDVPF